MKLTKEGLRSLVRQMIKEEKGTAPVDGRKTALRNMIREQLSLIKEERFEGQKRIPLPKAVTQIVIKGFGDANWSSVKPRNSQESQDAKNAFVQDTMVLQMSINGGVADATLNGSVLEITGSNPKQVLELLIPFGHTAKATFDKQSTAGKVVDKFSRSGIGYE